LSHSTQGYAQEAINLLKIYEVVPFRRALASTLRMLPRPPRRLLDIGAGTGRDAAGFAALRYDVVATEPVTEMREGAKKLHPDRRIEWLDDSLPDLARLGRRRERFDIIMLTAVWMHLDEDERRRGLRNVAALLRPGGTLVISLRYGPVPPGRRMFAVATGETIALARAQGLVLLLKRNRPTLIPRAQPVTWKQLVFRRPQVQGSATFGQNGVLRLV
jgi:SAM-dependent methyltransferase